MNKFTLLLLNFNINAMPQKLKVQESKVISSQMNQLYLFDNLINIEEQKKLSFFSKSCFNLLFSMEFYKKLNTIEKVDEFLNEEISYSFILNFVEQILIDESFKDRSIDKIMYQVSDNLEFDLSINEKIENILKTRENTNSFLREISDSKIRNCLVNNSTKLNEEKFIKIMQDYLKKESKNKEKDILDCNINKQFYVKFLKETLNIMQNRMKFLYKIDSNNKSRVFYQNISKNNFYQRDPKNQILKIFDFNNDFLLKFEDKFKNFELISLKKKLKEFIDISKIQKNSLYKNYIIQLFIWHNKENLFNHCLFDEKNLENHISYWYILIYYFLEKFKPEGNEGALDRNYQFYDFIQSFYNKDENYVKENHLELYNLLVQYNSDNYIEFIEKLSDYGYSSANNFYNNSLNYHNIKKYFQGIFYVLDERGNNYFDYNGFVFFECIKYSLFNNTEMFKLILDSKDLICSECFNIKNALPSDKFLKKPEIEYIYSFEQFKVDVLESLTSVYLELYKYNIENSNGIMSKIFIDKLYAKSYLNLCFYNGLLLENSFIKLKELNVRKIDLKGFSLDSIEINQRACDLFRIFILSHINEYSDFISIKKLIYYVLKTTTTDKDISSILNNYKKTEGLKSDLIYYYDIYDNFIYDPLINKEKTKEEYIINHNIKRIYTMFLIENIDIYIKITKEENNLIFNECKKIIVDAQGKFN